MIAAVVAIIVVASAVWVLVDASNLGVRRGCLGGGMFDMGKAGWFFATLLLWVVGFPAYLATRPRYVEKRGRA